MPRYVKVVKVNEMPAGTARAFQADGKAIALFNVDGKFCAIDNTCTHRGGPLAEGAVEGDVVTCPWHGAQFKVTSGEVLGPPAPQGVKSFHVRVTGDDVEVEIE